ncbi:hypothetical protein ASE75_06160 [Sphingomonas sp. Leaf17]|uniref:hypothetical protein n=1 Tax=Sphingomonas sp. Leaf17 TaxID=1735683 RepID=UPI0006FBB054|nr:hypothetical protein [Sphingomonas sp. Leaf17]KQM65810.1 hypothetical protein ASE75_06160 [Sphingomonas sp. Leaf17]
MTVDPDLLQDIEDLRGVYAEMAAARAQARGLDPVINFRGHAAAKEHAADRHGVIATRARRRGMDPDVMLAILAADRDLQARLRRRPSPAQLVKHLSAEAAAAISEDDAAQQALAVAQQAIARTARVRVARSAALRAFAA